MQSTDERDTGAVRLASTDSGDPGRAHVVLVHGFSQSSASWDLLAGRLADGLWVSAIDLPGHAGSSSVEVADLDETARLLGATGGRAIYVGYSLGGRAALTLAVNAPELVEALVLVSASPGLSDPVERVDRRLADERLAERLDPSDTSEPELDLERFIDEWLAQPLFAHLTEESTGRAARLVNSTSGLARSLRSNGTGAMRPLHDELGALEMPVLCVAGELDVTYAAIAREMSAEIGTNAAAVIVPECGHAVPFERPDAFMEAIRDFLTADGRSRRATD